MDFMKLVKVDDGQPVTSSRNVAFNFGKRHADVLEAITKLIKTENSVMTNCFYKTSYTAGTGKSYPVYLMNRDGFSLLAMGFTGSKALKWKLKYIDAFNRMERVIKEHYSKQMTPAEEMAHGLLAAKKLLDEKDALIKELTPKGLFADAVAGSKDAIAIGQEATLITKSGVPIGRNKLFEWLRKHNFLIKGGRSKNHPSQLAIDLGVLTVKESVRVDAAGKTRVDITPLVTGKGQKYFIEKLKEETAINDELFDDSGK